jgi:cytochrome c-type biogenesis protein CcmH
MKKLVWINIVFLLTVFGLSDVVFAQSLPPKPSDDEVNEIASQLYCPICENVRLDVCNTEICKVWREEIRQQLADVKSEEEILSYFVNQFGSQVLADPSEARWLFNISPILIFLSGLTVIIWVYRTRKVNLPFPEPHNNFDDDIKDGNQS